MSSTHVLAAVFKAVNDMLNSRLKSRNVHSEIVFDLSPTNNVRCLSSRSRSHLTCFVQIADSYRRFGVTDNTTSLLAIKVGTGPIDRAADASSKDTGQKISLQSVTEHLKANIEGQGLDFTDEELSQLTDMAAVNKVYKLGTPNKPKATAAAKQNEEPDKMEERQEAETAILAIIALKGS